MPIAGPEPSPVPLQAIVAGAVACAVFGMPILLAFTLGFILKAVGPAIVIQLMFDLQRKGRGVDKGAPSVYAQKLRFAHGAGLQHAMPLGACRDEIHDVITSLTGEAWPLKAHPMLEAAQ